jgi:vacuolar-type H+-ATPase subunit E/Vma4
VSDGALVKELLATLTADAEVEAHAVVERARTEAVRITAESDSQRAAELERRKAKRAEDRSGHEGSLRMAEKRKAGQAALGARQRVVERVVAAARALLADAATDEWLANDLERVLAYVPPGKATIRCAPRAAAKVKRLVSERGDITVEGTAGITAGVLVETADHRLLVDGTLDSRLERMRAALAIDIVAAVEGRGA